MNILFRNRQEKGITLIALVVTIIVLLILAGISITMLTGDNGILNQATKAKIQNELAMVEEEANLIYSSLLVDNLGNDDISLEKIAMQLSEKGYNIENVVSNSSQITGIKLENNSISISKDGNATIRVIYEGSSDDVQYYAVVKGKYYLMTKTGSGITIAKTSTEVDNNSSSSTLTATSNNEYVTVGTISGNTITLNGGSTVGSSTITVTYGSYNATCNASVTITPTSTQVAGASTSTTVTSTYGLIDVVWLSGKTNTTTTTPNAPVLSGMTPVTWSYDSNTSTWTEDSTAQTSWYNYTAGTGYTDNTTSMWANAKNSDGSYFVWIPRYAYRITYYDKDPSDSTAKITGYYDGYGMWNADTGDVKYKLDEGIETVEYNGSKYIVHPAFETNLDNGGWDKDLAGFWIAKYEMSREDSTDGENWIVTNDYYGGNNYLTTNAGNTSATKIRAVSKPGVTSWRYINIGNMYTNAYNYNRTLDSHMTKNSEWGAVAYLTHSKYGRNGKEIDVNSSSSFITGNGGGAINAYNTALGSKASTTGNIYGVYDMSGGAWEYTAAFNDTDSNNYETSHGSSFASTTGVSTKYATKYSNGTATCSGTKIYDVGKIGDATKETYKGSGNFSWSPNDDFADFVGSGFPFFGRGGGNSSGSAGVFYSHVNYGNSSSGHSFRVVLAP